MYETLTPRHFWRERCFRRFQSIRTVFFSNDIFLKRCLQFTFNISVFVVSIQIIINNYFRFI